MTDQPIDPDKKSGADSSEPAGDYEVGYGKPPKHGQFKPGNKSGKGKPKGAKNLKTIALAALGAKVSAKINGKTGKASKMEVAAHQLANKASAGDMKAIGKAMELYEKYGPQELPEDISEEEAAFNKETLDHYYRMRGWCAPEGDGEEKPDDE